MDALRTPAATHDLSALAWVQEELRKTLESAHKALRRHLREAESSAFGDLDDVEPTILRHARQQLHVGVGALELVNLPEGAMLMRASEALVQRFVVKPQRIDVPGVEAVEAASFALLDYLARRISGKSTDPVGLFAQLHTLLELTGADRIHPADLWPNDWRWRSIATVVKIDPISPNAATLAEFERLLLGWVKQNRADSARSLRNTCAALGQRAASAEETILWRLAAGFFDGVSIGALAPDNYVKRTASRLMQHLRSLVKHPGQGQVSVAERLAQDLLFFCACVPASQQRTPFLVAVRDAYDLPAQPLIDYTTTHYGRYDPAWISQARKRVEAAKQAWSGVAGDEPHRIAQLVENFSLVGDSVRRLYGRGDRLATALVAAAEQTVQRGRMDSAEMAMEVATSLLYLEASLEERDFDQPGQDAQIDRLAERLDRVCSGRHAEPLEAWIEQLYRRVSDRQTMSSVVQELRASLSEVERQIDQFFRNPRESGLLVPVPSQLRSMHGVLGLLGIDQACLAIERMTDDVDNLVQDQLDSLSPAALPAFHRLAGNLGALGFLIDTLAVQPGMASSLFVFDKVSGIISPVMGRHVMAPDLIDRVQAIADAVRREQMPLHALSAELDALSRNSQISGQPALAASLSSAQDAIGQAGAAGAGRHTEDAVREHIAQAMDDFVATANNPVGLDPMGTPLISRPMDLNPAPPEPTGLEGDSEMRAVFLEESREVLGEAQIALAELARTPGDVAQITTVRRAFHTLKGSARMVGLAQVAEAAWAYEQLYNRWLADQTPASGELRLITGDALHYLGAWVDAIAQHDDDAFLPDPLIAAADTLRLAGELMRVPAPQRNVQPVGPSAYASGYAAAPAPSFDDEAGDGVDFEVPLDEPQSGVFEMLQATQPIDLRNEEPLPVWDRTAPIDLPLQFDADAPAPIEVDLLLDLDVADGPAGAPLELDFGTSGAYARHLPPTPTSRDLPASPPQFVEPATLDAPAVPVGSVRPLDEAPVYPPDQSAWSSEDDMPVLSDLMPELGELEHAAEAPASTYAPNYAEPPVPVEAAQPPATAVDDALSIDSLSADLGADNEADLGQSAFGDVASEMTLLDLSLEEAPTSARRITGGDDDARSAWQSGADEGPLFVSAAFESTGAPPIVLDETAAPDSPPLDMLPSEEIAPVAEVTYDEIPAVEDLFPSLGLAGLPPIEPPVDGSFAAPEVPAPVASEAVPEPLPEPIAAAAEPLAPAGDDDEYRHIGALRLKIPLFNIYLNEADELSRRLSTELAEWALELHRPVGESAVALAHSLAGNSATVGFSALSHLARELEHALQRSDEIGKGQPEDAALFGAAGDEIRHLLHQFAAGFLREPPPELAEQLSAWQHQADQILLARLARNSVLDSRIDAPTTLSPELGLMPPDMPFDPADLPEEVADTGWQREADSPLPPPLGTPTDNAAFMAGQPPPQAHWWDAKPSASEPAPAPEAPSSAEQRIEPSFADELPSMSIFDPSQPAEPELGAVATPEAAAFDVDFDLDALTPPSVAGALPELPAFDAAAAQPADAGDRAATPPAAELPGAPAAKVVTLADLALPVPEVLKPLSEDEAAAHFESFAASLMPKAPAGPPTASDWTTDISFDLPSVPGAPPPAPPRRRELADASATELMFPTIPGNDIELVVDGKLQQPPAPPPAPVEPAWSEPAFEATPEPSPESLATPDISLDLLDDFVSQPAQPTQSARAAQEAQDEFDDSRPVAGEELLDIDLFEPAPEEEPYSEPLTQMAELPAEALPSSLATTLAEAGDSIENLDQDLFPVFEEEALDLLPVLTQQLQSWRNYPSDPGPGTGCMRTLHTFKGGARLAGAMRLGELAHAMEATIENILGADLVDSVALAALQPQSDKLIAAFEALRSRFNAPRPTSMSAFGGLSGMVPLAGDSRMGAVSSRAMPFTDSATTSGRITVEPLVPSMPMPLDDDEAAVDEADLVIEPAVSVAWRASQLGTPADLASARAAIGRLAEAPVVPEPIPIDWAQLVGPPATAQAAGPAVSTLPVRVRPQLLDRLVNLAGEVSITRARLESEVGQMRGSLVDLSENLDRLNQQLRDVALQAETQLESRMEAARALSQAFDPLELDRYTRLQELTRMMAESVNDVATVRSSLQRTLQTTEDELAMQGRLTRELQGDLLRTRMLEFDSLSERLQRVVRQAAAESGKQTRLDIAGGSIEVDRGVLDRMTPAFEHLLRNCVGHGIEYPETRAGAGKDPTGSIVITVQQEGNEVSVEIRDDGAGLDLLRIRDKALAMGLLSPDALPTENALAQLIFAPGLSTAGQLTELSGRGVGMDVVRSDVQALGGRIEIHTQAGVGTRFKLVLPLTTVVTQVVLLRAGGTTIAVPSHLIELVQRASSASLQQAYASGSYLFGGMSVPFYWLGALLESSGSGSTSGRTRPVIIVRSAQQRVALHVDEVQGNQEVVVKNLGAQLSRLPGLAGLTLLASGGVALIYNPVALATVYGTVAHEHTRVAINATQDGQPVPTAPELAPPAPLVLVVDDSLTVRRVTRRLLEREGWRVAVAKDGMEALESLANERPVLVLSDIEMPRMDGFDLLRNIRADAQFGDLPVIMITSRIAQKHREHALQLGANHYLGKPYAEEELLALVRSYAKRASRTS